ncbi:DUF427 domain-containing protein [Christiangramia flava]|uniref:DUF427 domain-containing protein n=1 Tax=Christiangramia flava JLT2011 TaxID=1229726 RepID=A0A1L7I6R3_9FLAO|nr:DUF427 domain-containing protein [Christiangramia flava]APU68792.1 hypothetical protein GRFL_2068 [Christiangramia flava JLT2011]OSS39063.1 hypothetical protein C723_2069 [Christiangramia flava JLT2011]
MKAVWNGSVIAESEETRIVESNHYFPMDSLKPEYFTNSKKETRCAWKGKAAYFHLHVKGEVNEDAAWYYPKASYAAKPIENYVAFWKGVKVTV